MPSHRIRPTSHTAKKKTLVRRTVAAGDPVAPAWPSYTGTSEYVGSGAGGRVQVWVDPTLGQAGLQNAQDLVADAARIVAANDAYFGTSAGNVNVTIFALGGATDGTGGADHMGCDYATGNAIEVCASFGNSQRCSGLFEAELSECAMNGSLCGLSTGEALSRWCANDVCSNALSDFATAPTWQADGMPNFVDSVDPTDGNPDSTGCGMAFISWLLSLGSSLPTIAQAMVKNGDGGTFCQLYGQLTGDDPANAWTKFQAAIAALPFGIVNDDPFGSSMPQPAPAPGPTPSPTPTPGSPSLADAQAASATIQAFLDTL
jgi:hypothetical protein